MKSIIIMMLVLFSFPNNTFSQCASTSNVYSFIYNGKTYEVVKELKNWADASACAVERGGYLVEINDINEQNAVYDAIINQAAVPPNYTSVSNGGGIAYVWIGATDKHTEGKWLWDGNSDNVGLNFWTGQGANGTGNGSPVNGAFNNWGGKSIGTVKEPDNYGAGQHHGAIALAGWPAGTTMLGIAGEWNDIIGSSSLYFVIEKDNTTGIKDNKTESQVNWKVYPNPTNGILNFDNTYKTVEIYNIQGRLISTYTNRKTIDISGFAKGTYIIIVIEDKVKTQYKIILN